MRLTPSPFPCTRAMSQGGALIWIAPSGGRDRPKPDGSYTPDPYDPAAVELMRNLVQRAKQPGALQRQLLGIGLCVCGMGAAAYCGSVHFMHACSGVWLTVITALRHAGGRWSGCWATVLNGAVRM